MSIKGKSGQQAGQDNSTKVANWIAERTRLRDWDEYAHNGRVNRSIVADELDISRSVTIQNPEVKRLLAEADKLWFKAEPITKAAQDASIERTNAALGKASSENRKLTVRIAELEAENRKLQKDLTAYKRIHDLIASGEAGFKP